MLIIILSGINNIIIMDLERLRTKQILIIKKDTFI